MAQAPFLAISYKNRSFESVFSGNENLNTFPYTLTKPEKQYVMAFKEAQLDEVLALIGMTRANITGQLDTERPNVKILQFNEPYEYSINYDSSVNQTIQTAVDKVFIEACKKHNKHKFSVHFTNNAQSLGQKWTYADESALHIFMAAIGNASGYEEVTHTNGMVPVKSMSNFMIPDYVSPDAVIKMEGIPVAYIKGDKIILMIYIAQYLNPNSPDDRIKEEYNSAMVFLAKSLDAVFTYITEYPDIFKKLVELEKEYKFMEFLSKLITKRSETHIRRNKEVQTLIPQVMSQLADLTNEQEYLSRILNALDTDGEKKRLLAEINVIRKSADVKDIVFEEDALMINMKHVMIPYQVSERDSDKKAVKDMILHCGELTVILPFDSKKELLVLRSDFSKYPENMKSTFKKLSCPHPNVFNAGRLCYGNTAETFAQLRGLFDISSIFVMINNFLHVYNPKSPTIDPTLFPKTTVEEAMALYNSMYPDDQLTADIVSYSDPVD